MKNLKAFEDDTRAHDRHVLHNKNATKDDEGNYYLICNGKFDETITEDWKMWYKDKLRAHENSTSDASTSRGFICDFCVN